MRVMTLRRLGRGLLIGALVAVLVSAAAAEMAHERAPAGAGDVRELVVLVHGMGRTRFSMLLLERRLAREGYRVESWGYSSGADSVAEVGRAFAAHLDHVAGDAPRVHLVGHSLGNVVIRWSLANDPPPRVGRVVMLAPPNQGSAAADRYAELIGWLMPPIREIGTGPASLPRRLPPPAGVEVGIIAGKYDGKVTVAETRLDGARGHAVVPAMHSFLMNRDDVHALVLRFLREGTFGPRTAPAETPLARSGGV